MLEGWTIHEDLSRLMPNKRKNSFGPQFTSYIVDDSILTICEDEEEDGRRNSFDPKSASCVVDNSKLTICEDKEDDDMRTSRVLVEDHFVTW